MHPVMDAVHEVHAKILLKRFFCIADVFAP
jgi:hypothetical protein